MTLGSQTCAYRLRVLVVLLLLFEACAGPVLPTKSTDPASPPPSVAEASQRTPERSVPAASDLPSLPARQGSWSEAASVLLARFNRLEHAAGSGDELYAVGTQCSPYTQADCSQSVLATTDGATWLELGTLRHDLSPVNALLRTSAGLVAIGEIVDATGHSEPAIWFSTDGHRWASVASASIFSPAADGASRVIPAGSPVHVNVRSIATGPGGVVAVGDMTCTVCIFEPGIVTRPAVWTSPDGGTWSRAAWTPGLPLATTILGDSTGYIAAGSTGIWTSADGVHWEAAQTDLSDLVQPQILDIAATQHGFVAIGSVYAPGQRTVWTSPDGRSWLLQPISPAFDRSDLAHVRSISGMAVAVGTAWSDLAQQYSPATWWSSDGIDWRREFVTEVHDHIAWDVGTVGDQVVVIGAGGELPPQATAWVRARP